MEPLEEDVLRAQAVYEEEEGMAMEMVL